MKTGIIGPLCIDEIIIGKERTVQAGGASFYAGRALSALGDDVRIISSFSPEDMEFFKKETRCSDIICIGSERTTRFVNEYPDPKDPDTRIQHAEINHKSLSFEDVGKHIEELDIVLAGPLFHSDFSDGVIRKIARTVKTALLAQGLIRHSENGKVVWEEPQNAANAMRNADYVFLDDTELAFIFGSHDIKRAAKLALEKGAKVVAVTLGKDGSLLFTKKREYVIRPFVPEKLSDPTGAGDSYAAGFLHGLKLFGGDIGKAGIFASMTATISIETKGAFSKPAEYVIKRLEREGIRLFA
ncbi:MAG: hypothetical protein GXO64_03695 [Candidatus Micrarchaeota archaeon]|nr:hypothetical protein [Candidatus Micrarchaeota archaeon]